MGHHDLHGIRNDNSGQVLPGVFLEQPRFECVRVTNHCFHVVSCRYQVGAIERLEPSVNTTQTRKQNCKRTWKKPHVIISPLVTESFHSLQLC